MYGILKSVRKGYLIFKKNKKEEIRKGKNIELLNKLQKSSPELKST